MAKCVRQFDFIKYDGTNGQDVLDAIADREPQESITWTLVSDTGTVLTVNWHGDQDQPYEILLNQTITFDGPQWQWGGAPLDPAVFAERYQVV